MSFTTRVLLAASVCAGTLVLQAMAGAVLAAQGGACSPLANPPQPQPAAPLLNDGAPNKTGDYIVVYRPGTPVAVLNIAQGRIQQAGGQIIRTYDRAMIGLAVRVSHLPPIDLEKAKDAMRTLCGVEYVEADLRAQYNAQQTQLNAPRGLDRTDQHEPTLNNTYRHSDSAAAVHAYVIDSGIDLDHEQFKGRIDSEFTVVTGDTRDCNGHGTAVAGAIGGKTFGIAKNVRLHSVRVADERCGLSTKNLIDGINAVIAAIETKRTGPNVVNMSISVATPVTSLDGAVSNLIQRTRAAFVVSAGNRHMNTCAFSPGGSREVYRPIAVGAAQSDTLPNVNSPGVDTEPTFSNYGACVDLYAPGVDIETAIAADVPRLCDRYAERPRPNDGMLCNGTSMAAAHVSGCIATFLQTNQRAGAEDVRTWLNQQASRWTDAMNHTAGFSGIISPESVALDANQNPLAPAAPINWWHEGTPNVVLYCGPDGNND